MPEHTLIINYNPKLKCLQHTNVSSLERRMKLKIRIWAPMQSHSLCKCRAPQKYQQRIPCSKCHPLITALTLVDHCRYGGTRADRTRLPMAPSEDEDNDESKFFEANVKLERSECLRKESNVRFNYHNIIDKVYSN